MQWPMRLHVAFRLLVIMATVGIIVFMWRNTSSLSLSLKMMSKLTQMFVRSPSEIPTISLHQTLLSGSQMYPAEGHAGNRSFLEDVRYIATVISMQSHPLKEETFYILHEGFWDERFLKRLEPPRARVVLLTVVQRHHTGLHPLTQLPMLQCQVTTRTGSKLRQTARLRNLRESEFAPFSTGMWICEFPLPTGEDSLWTQLASPPLVRLVPADSFLESSAYFPFPLKYLTSTSANVEQTHFGLCIPPLFGHQLTPMWLSGFLEMVRLLAGSSLSVHMYNLDALRLTPTLARVWSHYKKQLRLTVTQWRLPSVVLQRVHYHLQLLAIQHCLYRRASETEFILFHDVDEILVPRSGPNWRTLLMTDNKSLSSTCGICFPSAFFFNDLRHDTESLDKLSLQSPPYFRDFARSNAYRTDPRGLLRCKCLVSSRKVVEMGIHHVEACFDWSSASSHDASGRILGLPETEALWHHYSLLCQVPQVRRNRDLCRPGNMNDSWPLEVHRDAYLMGMAVAVEQLQLHRHL